MNYVKLLLIAVIVMLAGCGTGGNKATSVYDQRMTAFGTDKPVPGAPMMIGDSITQIWGIDGTFPAGWTNRGIGGDKSSGVISRLPQHLADKPGEIILLIGTNELDTDTTSYSNNIKTIISMIKAQGVKLTIVSILPRLDGTEPNNEVTGFNNVLKELCSTYQVRYFDINGYFKLANGQTNPDLFQDIVHPNHNGYNLMAQIFKQQY
jgi:lysophospholipase L1-like esterase